MAIEVTFEPAEPKVTDGITVIVSGEVEVKARVEMSLASKVRETSPAFTQGANPSGINEDKDTIAITGSPAGGDFTLTINGDETDPIDFDADAAAIKSAIEAASDGAVVTVTGTNPTFTVTFGGDLTDQAVTVTADGSGLTGGTDPDVTVTEVTGGGTQSEETSGPFRWGPLYLPDDGSWSVDVVAAEDSEDPEYDEGDSLLDAPETLVVDPAE